MASIGHLAVGALAGRIYGSGSRTDSPRARGVAMAAFAGLSVLPDLDVLWVSLGVPDHGLEGHRGFTHTWLFALLVAVIAAACARVRKWPVLETASMVFAVVASHGVLDAMTYHSRGTMLLWPLVADRLVVPWRPLPSAPTGLEFIGLRGLEVAFVETLFFLPVLLLAFWRRLGQGVRHHHPLGKILLVAGVVTSSLLVSELTLRNWDVVSRLETSSAVEVAAREQNRLWRKTP